jgi:hypothetical protein
MLDAWRLFGVEALKAEAGRDHRFEQELDGSAKKPHLTSFGANDVVDLWGSKALSGTTGSPEPRVSEVFRDPRCQRIWSVGRLCGLGLDAYSSLELEYAEALRTGGVRGLIPVAKGFEVERAGSLLRGVERAGCLGSGGVGCLLGSWCRRFIGARGADSPVGLEVPRLFGVEVSKAFRSSRCQRFGADVSAGPSGFVGAKAFEVEARKVSEGLEVLRALWADVWTVLETGGVEALRSRRAEVSEL